uniref:Eukaryotic translation initiation factor 4G n=1 Tax=Rhizophora mucronata TaxID=61149 RepID=A0A2P2MST1_RHIMU
MSFNQSRSDKSETPRYQKSGRYASFNQPRSSSAAYGKGGGVGGGPAPSPSFSSNRSLKKSNNVQGGQSRVYSAAVNSSDSSSASFAAPRNVQNGAHVQPSLHGGASDAPVASSSPRVTEAPAAQRSTPAIPKAPVSQPATMSSDTAGQSAPVTCDTLSPKTPAKGPRDASKGYPFQFGSLSPGFMNGMQIPARTNSAPPNLDEQKHDLARHDTYRSVSSLPTPAPKPQLPRKDTTAADQSNIGETHLPRARKDAQVSHVLPVSQTQRPSVHSIPMTSVPMTYHPPPVSVQFGGPNPQIQSQVVTASSLPMAMSMALSMGNAPQMQQPLYVQGLPPHPMQPQGIMHQAQGLGFPTPMAPQLPPQPGNLGISITSQYPQQHSGIFSGQRKTSVKITDPKTHEELRLDKQADTHADSQSSGLRTHTSVPSQSQQIQFGLTHNGNYYAPSYNTSNLCFPSPTSLPIANSQMAPNFQSSRFNHSSGQGPQTLANTSAINSMPANKPGNLAHSIVEPVSSEHLRDGHNTISSTSSGYVSVTVKPPAASIGQKTVELPLSNKSSVLEKGGSHKSSGPTEETSLSHSQKDSESCLESSLQQSMHDSESSASKSSTGATKQPMAVTDNMDSSALLPASPAQAEESFPVVANIDGRKNEALSRSNSIKDHQKKTAKKGHNQFQQQIVGQSTSMSSLPSRGLEHGSSSDKGASETVESKKPLASMIDDVSTKIIGVSMPMVSASTPDPSLSIIDSAGDNFADVSSELSGVGAINGGTELHHVMLEDSSPLEQPKIETSVMVQGKDGLTESSQQDDSSEICTAHDISKPAGPVKQAEENSVATATASGNDGWTSESAQVRLDEPVTCHIENDKKLDEMDVSVCTNSDSVYVGKTLDNHTLAMDAPLSKGGDAGYEKSSGNKFSASDLQCDSFQSSDASVATSKHEAENVESIVGSFSPAFPGSKEKSVELTVSKSSNSRVKKRFKEILQKADAAGTTSDLYMAYKGPEEKKEDIISSGVGESTSSGYSLKPMLPDGHQGHSLLNAEDTQPKVEPDDWEDAADMSTPKLETSNIWEQAQCDKNGNANTAKKYSRDFLLKFAEHCTGLPEGFEFTSDIAEVMMSTSISYPVDRDAHPSPARVIDRSNSGPRSDRRGSGVGDDDRWSKLPGAYGLGRDLRVDIGYGGNIGFRPAQGGNFGVLKNPRAQSPVAYIGGILTGPMQSMGPLGGMQRNGPDADRWQRSTNFQQKGLIPSPQTPLQMMHKADRKYEVAKVTDEEEAKQRQLKAILNKLTPQNFEKLFEQVKAVEIDNTSTLNGVISQIFDKALMEPTFCEMYANFCHRLAGELPDFSEDNEKITFKRVLLNKCQEEFERGEREQEEANKADEEGETKCSEEEREEKRLKARRRMLGNIRLIGELYKKRMLTERIMHECIKKLLGQSQNPDEEDVEALCKLMSTIGEMIDHPKAKEHMDAYFDIMTMLSNNMKMSSRLRFMLKDAIDLRKNKWQQRRKVEGPKKIEEVHRDAAQERQHQASRLARNPSTNASARRVPADFGARGSSMLSSPSAQMGGFRGLPTQARSFGNQDVRFEDRQSYEARTLTGPLHHRPLGDDSITLGPQGGLARGMSIRGRPAIASTTVADIGPGELRRMTPALNGLSNVSERPMYGVRDDLVSRFVPDRFTVPATNDHPGSQDRNLSHINRDSRNVDRGFDRHLATSPLSRSQGPSLTQNVPSEKVWSEECLSDKSMAAIKEFYSARDEKEVTLCIIDLNSRSFHPSMISLWINDSFERKDIERDLLAKLLVNLKRSQDGILTQAELIKGFQSVLTTLEDAINDAPRAAEFLGRIFAKVVLDNVVALAEISQLLQEGGEEPGRLLEVGLAGDVLGSTLEIIRAEKGENVLNDIRNSSNLRLEDFRPPGPYRSRILENFI